MTTLSRSPSQTPVNYAEVTWKPTRLSVAEPHDLRIRYGVPARKLSK